MRIVLASRSPRRREILGWLGLEFEVVEPAVEELRGGLAPAELVLENARRKARAGLATLAAGQAGTGPDAQARGPEAEPNGTLVLGVDTEVFLDRRALGQPADRAQAEERLRALSGGEHEVLSGVCLLDRTGGERSGVARSLVELRDLDEALLRRYLDSGEWRGRAGAYAIQGLGSILIARVEGDFSNVVGLPIATLLDLAPELR